MSANRLQASLPPMEINSIDGHGPRRRLSDTPAKAVSQSKSIALTNVVKDALLRHYGSLKAAAITLDYDLGQLSRDLASGDFKLKRLEVDEAAKVFVALALADHYGRDPHAEARRLIREMRARLDELEDVVAVA